MGRCELSEGLPICVEDVCTGARPLAQEFEPCLRDSDLKSSGFQRTQRHRPEPTDIRQATNDWIFEVNEP